MRFRLFVLTAFATLVFASTASADTFCVTDSGVDGTCDATFASLQDALDVANIDPPADTIRLDPRKTFDIDDLTTGPNPYPVTLESANDEEVTISRDTAGTNDPVLATGYDVTLKRLDFFVGSGGTDNLGIRAQRNLKLEDVRIDVADGATNATGIQLVGPGTSDFSRVFVRGGLYGIQQADGDLNAERTLVTNATNGYLMAAGSSGASPTAHFWQSSFLGNAVTGGRGVEVFNAVGVSADLFMRDSLITNYADAGLRRSGASMSHQANVTTNHVAVPPGAVADVPGNGLYVPANPMNAIPDLNPFELSEGIPRPVPGGNLVDVDPTTALQPGEDDVLDLDHNIVFINGARDIGAYEVHPAPTTAPSVSATPNAATISAQINGGGATTRWLIEFGTSAGSYDRQTNGKLNPSLSAQSASFAVSGLQPNTTYHYRITSENADGAGDTGDRTFTTASNPVAASAAVASALKLKPSKIKRKKKGKLSYSLDKPATVAFAAISKKKGNKKPKTVKLGTQSGNAGKNTFTLSTKKLKKGKYTVTLTPVGGQPKSVALTVK